MIPVGASLLAGVNQDFHTVVTGLLVVMVPAAMALLWRAGLKSRRRETERDATLARLVDVFLDGTPPDRFTGRPAVPSVVQQLNEIQEQLHRNGGTTLRDAVARTETHVSEIRVSMTEAARQASADQRRARVIEALLRKHMEDGTYLLEVGRKNDGILWGALRGHGIELEDPIPIPDAVLRMPGEDDLG